jgi:hypothetical protein
MTTRKSLTGSYRLKNEAFLREKAERDDPRAPFYAAMLKNRTYETYLADIGDTKIDLEGYKANPISGRMEILYARRNHWIEDFS